MFTRGEPTGYSKTIATTWSLAFERLEDASLLAVGLLRLLACLAPEPVPLLLLQAQDGSNSQFGSDVSSALTPLLNDSLAIGDAVAALRRYSFVTKAGDGLVLMHRLVQAVSLDRMPADCVAQWRQAAIVLLEAAIPADTSQPSPGRSVRRCWHMLRPHFQMPATAWCGLRTISARAAATPLPATFSRGSWTRIGMP